MMNKYHVLSFFVIVFSAVFFGYSLQNETSINTPSSNSFQTVSGEYTPFATLFFNGQGDESTDHFTLREGPIEVRMSHEGRSNFIVSLIDGEGHTVEYLLNKIGRSDWEKSTIIVDTGEYLLSIQADGKWAITISDPRAPDELEVAVQKQEKVQTDIEEIVPWGDFFENCVQQFPPTKLNDHPFLGEATDECEKEYAKKYDLPDYCEKVEDKIKLVNCWTQLAIIYRNQDYCRELNGIVVDSEITDCKNRAAGTI